MTKPVIVTGKSVTGQLIIRHLKRGDTFSMMFEYYEDGKRVQKMESTGLLVKGNARRAKDMLAARLQELESQLEQKQETHPGSDMRFSDWIRQWLETSKANMDGVTWQGYDSDARGQILPYFDEKGTTLAELTRPLLQDYIDEKSKSGRKDGKGGLSPKTIRHLKNVMQLAQEAAIKEKLIPGNYCKGLKLPEAIRYEYQYYNEEELNQMFAVLREEPLYPLFRITAVYGLRLSELMGLQWNSVDFINNRLLVKHTRVKMQTEVAKNKTKTKSSRRSFPLLPDVRELLLEAKEQEQENRRLFGSEYIENPYIFKWADGKPYAPDYVSKKFSALLKKHGLRHIRFHELRHSCATFLLTMENITLKDVQDWMGHANISITMDVYGHVDMKRKNFIANGMSARLAQETQKQSPSVC